MFLLVRMEAGLCIGRRMGLMSRRMRRREIFRETRGEEDEWEGTVRLPLLPPLLLTLRMVHDRSYTIGGTSAQEECPCITSADFLDDSTSHLR
jgi:hypothetical protein